MSLLKAATPLSRPRAGRAIDKIFIARGDVDKTLGHIASKAREKGIVVVESDRRKLDFGEPDQGASGRHRRVRRARLLLDRGYSGARGRGRGEPPFVIVCDEISDPHNLGAIIRTAECVGAHGVVIPKRRSAGLTAIVDKASAGAAEHMLIARVANLPAAIKTLKDNGLWIYGTAARRSERPLDDRFHRRARACDRSGATEWGDLWLRCDFIVSLPMKGQVSSLNASAAAAITMYEILRQRMG